MRVDVAEDARALGSPLVEPVGWDFLDIEELPETRAEGLLPDRVVDQAGDQTVGREDREARILERDECHQHVVGRTALADLALIGPRGSVAMVAARDQQLTGLEFRSDRIVNGRVVDTPHAMGGAVVVGHLPPEVLERGLEVLPGIAGMEGEDGGEVQASRSRQPQAILSGTRLRALMRPDALAVGREPDPGEKAASREA